ncbi:hypothetical protein J4413_01660 [Candidatus Woesearchaeota archaeon]|nr:hypothetical protein [Candidatus Woesearchaeota archaeon]
MTQTITILKMEYEDLKQKAKELDMIIDKEGLSKEELKLLEKAEESKSLTEEEAKKKYPKFFSSIR